MWFYFIFFHLLVCQELFPSMSSFLQWFNSLHFNTVFSLLQTRVLIMLFEKHMTKKYIWIIFFSLGFLISSDVFSAGRCTWWANSLALLSGLNRFLPLRLFYSASKLQHPAFLSGQQWFSLEKNLQHLLLHLSLNQWFVHLWPHCC